MLVCTIALYVYKCVACQKRRSDENASDQEVLSDGYGSLEGGTPRCLGPLDEYDKPKNKKQQEEEVHSPPRSPVVDYLKSGKIAYVSRLVIDQLRVTYGRKKHLLWLHVSYTTSWAMSTSAYIVQSHQTGDTAYVYIKMRYMDMVRFHGKRYEWGGSKATFS